MQYRVISVIFTPSVSPLSGGETSPPISRGRNRGGIKTIIEYITIRILVLLFPTLFIHVASAQIITVKQDGTGDYTTIQQAVDASIDGDTVLVWPGTYIENVSCEEKNITIGSLTLTTGNTSYIQQTIINGNYTGSCLEIESCQSLITIDGFTLKHGSGTWHGYISGGGTIIKYSTVNIYNCIVSENKANGYGGGIYYYYSQGFFSNVTVKNNHAYDRGGGILLLNSFIEFDSINKCNIYLNYAAVGTDIYKLGDDSPPIHVIVDTFTVIEPDHYYMYSNEGWGYPGNEITYEINEGKIQAVNQNLYVNTNGDNQNSGLSSDEPLKDISFALLKMASDSIQPDTIHISNGIYSLSSGEKFPLSLKKNVSIQGENRDSTILDAENIIYLLNGIVYADNYKISNLTLRHGNGDTISPYSRGAFILKNNRNAIYENILVTENTGSINSAGKNTNSNNILFKDIDFVNNIGGKALRSIHSNALVVFYDTVYVVNCRFIENYPDYNIPDEGFGGGATVRNGQIIYPNLMTCYFYNCLFTQNHTKNYIWGGSNSIGISNSSQAYVINCTMGDNTSDNSQGANIGVTYNSNLHIYNSILYGNYPAEIYMYTDDYGDCDLNIYNSLVQGGEEGIRILSPDNNVYYDYTNIDTDPLWDTAGFYPYMLTAGSPCINTGTLDLPEGVVLPETDILGNPRIWDGSVDMGAYEYGPWVGLDYYNSKVKKQKLLKAAPNPFNYGTYISYITKESGHIKIEVYDMNGRKVNTLMDVRQLPGSGEFYWDGTNDYGQKLPAGTYIINLIINDKINESVKIIKK